MSGVVLEVEAYCGPQVELNLSANQPEASSLTSCQLAGTHILDYTGADIHFSDQVANRASP